MLKQTFCLCPDSACCYLAMGTGRAGGRLYTKQVPRQLGAWLVGIQMKGSSAGHPSELTSWLCFTCCACWWPQSLDIIYCSFSFDCIFPIHFDTGKSRIFSQQRVHQFSVAAKLTWPCCWSHSYPASTFGVGWGGKEAGLSLDPWTEKVSSQWTFQHNWGNDEFWGRHRFEHLG